MRGEEVFGCGLPYHSRVHMLGARCKCVQCGTGKNLDAQVLEVEGARAARVRRVPFDLVQRQKLCVHRVSCGAQGVSVCDMGLRGYGAGCWGLGVKVCFGGSPTERGMPVLSASERYPSRCL